MTSLYEGKNVKDDIEEPTGECEDTELRDHAVPLHKGFSNQRTTWRKHAHTAKYSLDDEEYEFYCQRRRSYSYPYHH